MVGDDKHGFLDYAHALAFLCGCNTYKGFARANHMVVKHRAFLNAPPNGVFLMRAKFNRSGCAGQSQMRAIITRRDMGIEALVIVLCKAFTTRRISQTQSKKACRISSAFWLAAAVFSALVLRIRLPEASQPTTSLT